MEQARRNFPCGWPDVGLNGIRPLDPLSMSGFTITANGIGFRLSSELTNLVLRGLQQFNIYELSFNPTAQTVEYKFTIASMNMVGRHNTRGSMLLIPVVSGNGPMTVQMTNSHVHGIMSWGLDADGLITILDQWTWIDSQNVNVRMEGFGLMTNTINNNINDAIPGLLADPEFQAEINRVVNDIMFPAFSQIVYGKNPAAFTAELAFRAANPTPDRCFV